MGGLITLLLGLNKYKITNKMNDLIQISSILWITNKCWTIKYGDYYIDFSVNYVLNYLISFKFWFAAIIFVILNLLLSLLERVILPFISLSILDSNKSELNMYERRTKIKINKMFKSIIDENPINEYNKKYNIPKSKAISYCLQTPITITLLGIAMIFNCVYFSGIPLFLLGMVLLIVSLIQMPKYFKNESNPTP